MRRLLALLFLITAPALLLGACTTDDGGDGDADGGSSEASDDSTPASDDEGVVSDGGDFCTTVEENLEVATGSDLQAAIPAIEAMAAAAPDGLDDAFDENLAALQPVKDADSESEATDVFVAEVAAEAAYTESFTEIADGIQDECDIDITEG